MTNRAHSQAVTSLAGVNLMSPARYARVRQGMLTKRWVKGLALYVLMLGGLGVVLGGGEPQQDELREAVTMMEAKLQSRKSGLAAETATLEKLRTQLRAARSVGHHPEWGALLTALAGTASGSVTLDGFVLDVTEHQPSPAAARVGASRAKASERAAVKKAEITVSGVGQDLRAVNEFVVRLEDLGLFDQVRLKESNAFVPGPPSGTGNAPRSLTRFSVSCTMDEGKPAPGEAAQGATP